MPKATTSDPTKMNANQQKQVLSSLKQPVAAALIGMAPRALRDDATAPRNADDTYDGPLLVEWTRNRVTSGSAKLSDAENEMIAEIIDTCLADEAEWRAAALSEFFNALRDAHGDAGWVEFVSSMLNYLAKYNREYPTRRHSADDIRDAGEEAARSKRESMRVENHRLEMTISHRCDGCGKFRWGKKWNNTEPPATNMVIGDECPKCRAK